MAPKTIKSAIADALENLSKENFKKFCTRLLDRRVEPRVRRRQVEGKTYLEITDLLVSTFTEVKALQVTVDLLKEARCGDDAEELLKETAALRSELGSSDAARPSAGASGGDTMADKHFVDKHGKALIQRVSNIAPILDGLLFEGVIQQESYDNIRVLPTTQMKMRELYAGCLKAGPNCKDVFLKLLEENEKYLIEELKNK
ncbi:apoptosis-associated speck-like protein containing a CARD isoform X1 [Cheilinus undulatus]|uniref:apoptosis-associated speck-like protein containing a CARD isoform X1 n=1 Tax=Cheilinus undulatus TaxID=241271 RepID=UPI001BD4C0DB|nr:apoptosis-associated speck-like protein containing a CARD isoform X1 [Cheilinus undulatus]